MLDAVNDILWNWVLLSFLLGAGIFLTFACGFAPFRPRRVWRATFGSLRRGGGAGLRPYEATATALAGTVGTGNIVGVAAALAAGGPGAVFWMWASALVGMSAKFAEIALAVRYRVPGADGKPRGGPMYVLERGLGSRFLGVVFAVLCALCAFGIGNAVQTQSAAEALRDGLGVPPLVTGLAIAAAAAAVLLGGRARVARVNAMLVPWMSAFYMLGALVCIAARADRLGGAFSAIFTGAFSPGAAFGGAVGFTVAEAVRFGVSRGLFTNEAGMGSAPIAHAAADTDAPGRQAMWGVVEVALDTLLMCSLTALVILTADPALLAGKTGFALTAAAFGGTLGGAAAVFLCVSMVFFALAAVLGWGFYGTSAMEYLTPGRRLPLRLYRLAFVAAAALGAVAASDVVWGVADLLNGLMVLPNLTGTLLLWKELRFGAPVFAEKPP